MSLCADSVSEAGAALAVSGRISVGDVLGALKAATDEEMADLMAEIWRGNQIFSERRAAEGIVEVVAVAVEEKKKVAVKAVAAKEPKAKEPKAPKAPKAEIPQGDLSEAPGPEHYRLKEVNEGLCKARKTEGGEDRRWKPLVYGESQCVRKPVEGEDLCKLCSTLFEKESQDDKFKKWHGLVTEDLLAHTHILGSEWATTKCKWVGSAPPSVSAPAGTAESAPASEGEEAPVSSSSSAPAPAPAPVATPAKAPAKEAKAPKAPAAPKKAAAATKKEEPKPAAAPVVAAAAVVTEPVAEAGELKLLGGEFYWVSRGNVYEYDQIEETPGDFVGRLRADESIDADAEEEE